MPLDLTKYKVLNQRTITPRPTTSSAQINNAPVNAPILTSISKSGPKLDYARNQAIVASEVAGAKVAAQEAAKRQKFLDTYFQIQSLGKEFSDLSISDLVKASNGDPEVAGKYFNLIKTSKDASNKNDKAVMYDAAMAGLLELKTLAANIPSSKNRLAAKFIVGPSTKIEDVTLGVPDIEVYNTIRDIVARPLLKALGDAGALGAGESEALSASLNILRSPNQVVRGKAWDSIINIMDKVNNRIMTTSEEPGIKTDVPEPSGGVQFLGFE